MKLCKHCNKVQPQDEFYGHGRCKTCRKADEIVRRSSRSPEETLRRRKLKQATAVKRIAYKQENVPKGMKFCGPCEQYKADNAFKEGNKTCISCLDRIKPRVAERYRKLATWMDNIKLSNPCTDCGQFETDPSKMHWDHLPGYEKLHNVSWFVAAADKKGAIEEMKKCELVCWSCHGKRGIKRGQLKPWEGKRKIE